MFNYKKLLRKPEIDMPEDEIMQELVYYVKTSNAIVCKWVGGGGGEGDREKEIYCGYGPVAQYFRLCLKFSLDNTLLAS